MLSLVQSFGSAGTSNIGTSGASVPLLNAANTWSATQSFTAITGTTIGASGTLTSAIGTITASTPAFSATQTWNNVAVGFVGLFMNVTNTASLDPSYLVQMQVGGVDKFRVDKYGTGTFGLRGYFADNLNINTGTAIPSGGTQDVGIAMSSTAHFGLFFGSGVPMASQARGSLYLNSTGAPQVNLNGTTGWLPAIALGTAPVSSTATTYTMLATDTDLVFNAVGDTTITLVAATGNNTGRILWITTAAAHAVISASSNVVPLGSISAGTAILSASAGKWARLVSNGTNWVVMAGN